MVDVQSARVGQAEDIPFILCGVVLWKRTGPQSASGIAIVDMRITGTSRAHQW
jgi:hypothetical protein